MVEGRCQHLRRDRGSNLHENIECGGGSWRGERDGRGAGGSCFGSGGAAAVRVASPRDHKSRCEKRAERRVCADVRRAATILSCFGCGGGGGGGGEDDDGDDDGAELDSRRFKEKKEESKRKKTGSQGRGGALKTQSGDIPVD